MFNLGVASGVLGRCGGLFGFARLQALNDGGGGIGSEAGNADSNSSANGGEINWNEFISLGFIHHIVDESCNVRSNREIINILLMSAEIMLSLI